MKTNGICVVILLVTQGFSKVMEALTRVPPEWQHIDRAPREHELVLRIAMNQPQRRLFERRLVEMSTPDHSSYGRHMSREEVKAMLRPHSGAVAAVLQWLSNAGLDDQTIEVSGEWIKFIAPVYVAEMLLDTTFCIYRHVDTEVDSIRTSQYSVPEHLHKYIDLIQSTTRFSLIRSHRTHAYRMQQLDNSDIDAGCNSTITQNCLTNFYHISDYQINDLSTGFAAFNNFLQQYPRYNDLAAFEAEYAQYAVGSNFTWTSINDGLLIQDFNGTTSEANLDVQYLLSLGYPVPIHTYSTGGLGPLIPDLDEPNANSSMNEPYLDFLSYILSLSDDQLPHTLSTSYGEDEHSVPLQYRLTVCNMFAQLGARGVSVLFSSGDLGVGGACQLNDGTNRTRFESIFPATCPWVTGVGGTYKVGPEQAAPFSSGGFSDTWTRPSYQDKAVGQYLNRLGDQWRGLYNSTGRGFPDVSAQAVNYTIIDKAQLAKISGTSCAAPTFSGVIALLNSLRIQAGLPRLGFLNPFLYSVGYQGLTDIVHGGSTGCTGTDPLSGVKTPIVPYASWNATQGWDPVTGLGTPNFQKLLHLALNTSQPPQTSSGTSWRFAAPGATRYTMHVWGNPCMWTLLALEAAIGLLV